jgi:hypothetical protein
MSTHDELPRTSGLYTEIYYRQLCPTAEVRPTAEVL